MSTTVTPGGGGGAWPTAASPGRSRAAGFTDTFISRYVDTGELRLHAVTGGDGPPLLLVHGWSQTWYQWRMVMPALARDFQVVAVDQRSIGLSDKPAGRYDTGTLAGDLVALIDALGHQRFALVGHDTGFIVRGREDIFFGAEYAASAGRNKLPDDTVSYYVDLLASDPDALHGSFQLYRAFTTTAQDQQRKERRLTLPVLAIGGAESSAERVADTMKLTAADVQTLVIPDCGHWVAEQGVDVDDQGSG
jgi:pimeloyl-ACP methyl ester carboxylesterase